MAPPLQTLKPPQAALVETDVLQVRSLSPRALALRVARPPGFDFASTQVVALQVGSERRTLTIASGPEKPWLEFATLRGPSAFKTAVAALRPGDRVGLRGPYGRFLLDPARPAVMLAGHVGIGPFKAMLEHAVDAEVGLRGALLHAHPEGDAPYADDVARLAQALPGFHIAAAPTGGLADAARVAALGAPGAVYYIAGSPSEVASAASALEPLNLPRERVKVELFAGYP